MEHADGEYYRREFQRALELCVADQGVSRRSLNDIPPNVGGGGYELSLAECRVLIKKLLDQKTQLQVTIRDLELQLNAGRRGELGLPHATDYTVVLRQIFSNFKAGRFGYVDWDLMRVACRRYYEEFPEFLSRYSFSWVVNMLLNYANVIPTGSNDPKASWFKQGSLEYQWRLQKPDRKLLKLMQVAKDYMPSEELDWDTATGEQYFVLCKFVAKYNNEYFHPVIEDSFRLLVLHEARKGKFVVDQVDLGNIVEQLVSSV